MHRLTVYLDDDIYAAVVRHAEARGQKLTMFVSRELAPLVHKPAGPSDSVKALLQLAEANAKGGGR